jgi:Flp pilus assembly protein TadD
LRAEDVKLLKTYIKESNTKENFKFTGVELSSYASPDGELDLNEKLSQRRDKSAIKFLKKELRRSKVEGYKDDKFYTSKTTAEDWKGFEKLMQASDIQDKQLVLRVLQMYSDPIVREKEIKIMAKVYTELADEILPKLRRSKLTVNIDVIGLTNEELIDKATRVPDTLTNEELLFAANLADDNKTKLAIYESTASSFPKDWRAMNNIGVIYVEQNNIEGAKKAFENAKRANENSTVLNNLGVIELLMGNFDEAETYFKAGMGAGQEVNHNLGIVNIKKGDYSSAISKFGKEASFNVVLAKILSKDYSGALSTIEKIKNKDAMTFYLKAIIGARQDNKDLAMNSLRSAISQDPTLSGQAKTDLEFFKYFEDDTFKGIVK